MHPIIRPGQEDTPPYGWKYINLLPGTDLHHELIRTRDLTVQVVNGIPSDQGHFAYAEGKWTIGELIAHVSDAERVFAYRALRFSRQDTTELPGFDEDWYAPRSHARHRTLDDILHEYVTIRSATLSLFGYLTDEMLDFRGKANKVVYTARSLGWMVAGHNQHHINILQERYLAAMK
ncbi:MAG: DinB family protein [Bacteroidetes bacterium]|nr:DinB family protein [Bacteroidota bacterium]